MRPFLITKTKNEMSIKKDFEGLNPYVKLGIIIAIGVILFIVIKYIYNKYKKEKEQQLLENSTVNTTIGNTPISVNLGTKASAINSAFHSNDWFGWTEDEETAMAELSNVPKQLIPNLSALYYQLYGENLKTDFQKYCSAEQYASISYLFS